MAKSTPFFRSTGGLRRPLQAGGCRSEAKDRRRRPIFSRCKVGRRKYMQAWVGSGPRDEASPAQPAAWRGCVCRCQESRDSSDSRTPRNGRAPSSGLFLVFLKLTFASTAQVCWQFGRSELAKFATSSAAVLFPLFRRVEPLGELAFQRRMVSRLTFPDSQYAPTGISELSFLSAIAFDVARELVLPELYSGFGCRGFATTLVPVPEAPMYEDGFTSGR